MMKWMTICALGCMGALTGWNLGGHFLGRGPGMFLALVLGLSGAWYGLMVARQDS